MNNKHDLIYEGKAKKVFTHDDANKVKIEFKDEATAFNALKKEKFEGKGKLNCLIKFVFKGMCFKKSYKKYNNKCMDFLQVFETKKPALRSAGFLRYQLLNEFILQA